MDLLSDLQEFFQAFSGMVGGFQERAKRVNELLADDQSTFLVVCGPQGEPISEAVYFHRKLVEAELPFGGVIVNKVHYELDDAVSGDGASLGDALADALGSEDLADRVAANFADYERARPIATGETSAASRRRCARGPSSRSRTSTTTSTTSPA